VRRSPTVVFSLLVLSGLAAGCGQSDGPTVPSGTAAVAPAPASSEAAPVVGSGRKKAQGSEAPGGVDTGVVP
jgi:hypothetical protein